MGTFILKRKTFANPDNNNKNGLSTAAKVGMGIAGTGLAFLGARRGLFGGGVQMGANQLWGKAGQALKSQGMVNSARSKFTEGFARLNGITNKETVSKLEQNLVNSANSGVKSASPFKDIVTNKTSNLPAIV